MLFPVSCCVVLIESSRLMGDGRNAFEYTLKTDLIRNMGRRARQNSFIILFLSHSNLFVLIRFHVPDLQVNETLSAVINAFEMVRVSVTKCE